ncbi:hypothetical protein D3C85_1140130 [compost metagenome]
MEHGGDHDEGAEEPVADIDMLGLALHHGAEEHHCVGDPDDGHPHRAGEFHLGVFLGRGQALREGDQQDHHQRLPAPEGEGRKPAAIEPCLAGALHRVVAGGEQRATAEGEDHQVGVQRAQAAEAGPGQVEVQRRPDELGGDEHPHAHADNAPDQGHERELADHLVVVGGFVDCGVHVRAFRVGTRRGATLESPPKRKQTQIRALFHAQIGAALCRNELAREPWSFASKLAPTDSTDMVFRGKSGAVYPCRRWP